MWRWFVAGALAWAALDAFIVWAWAHHQASRTPDPLDEMRERLAAMRRAGL